MKAVWLKSTNLGNYAPPRELAIHHSFVNLFTIYATFTTFLQFSHVSFFEVITFFSLAESSMCGVKYEVQNWFICTVVIVRPVVRQLIFTVLQMLADSTFTIQDKIHFRIKTDPKAVKAMRKIRNFNCASLLREALRRQCCDFHAQLTRIATKRQHWPKFAIRVEIWSKKMHATLTISWHFAKHCIPGIAWRLKTKTR